MIELRYLSRTDGIQAGAENWALAVDDVRNTTRLLRSGEAGLVAESVLRMGADPRSNAYGLPAFVGGSYDAVGLKWAVHLGAPAHGLPSITSTTLLNRYSDGRPLGFVESALLTRMRTAAVSALAISALAPSPIRHVAVLGAGEQARAHINMLLALFPDIESIRLWNRDTPRRDALADTFRGRGTVSILAATRISDALQGASVVLCCTTAPTPLLGKDAVEPGRLIIQVGYNEISFGLIETTDHVVVDLWGEFAEKSAKSLFQMYRAGKFKPEHVAADLTNIVVDGWRPKPGASVLFSSFGLNVFDVALAARVLRQAEKDGVGQLLSML